jgi:hypothetical protein
VALCLQAKKVAVVEAQDMLTSNVQKLKRLGWCSCNTRSISFLTAGCPCRVTSGLLKLPYTPWL